MGLTILGVLTNQPRTLVHIDPGTSVLRRCHTLDSIDPTKFFVGEETTSGEYQGVIRDIEFYKNLNTISSNLKALFNKFGDLKCPACGEKLVIEERDQLVCSNQDKCLFASTIDRFVEEEEGQ